MPRKIKFATAVMVPPGCFCRQGAGKLCSASVARGGNAGKSKKSLSDHVVSVTHFLTSRSNDVIVACFTRWVCRRLASHFFSEKGNAAGMPIFLSGPFGAVIAPALPRLNCHHNDAVLSAAGVPVNPPVAYAVLVPPVSANFVTRECRE